MDAYSSDRQFEQAATRLALMSFTISSAVIWLYMAVIQYLLLKIHISNSRIKPPTSLEMYIFVTALWIAHRILDDVLETSIDKLVHIFSEEYIVVQYCHLRLSTYNIRYWAQGPPPIFLKPSKDLAVLFYEVLSTWLISQSLFLLLDTIVPLVRDIRQNHHRVAKRLQSRCVELVEFVRTFNLEEDHHQARPKSARMQTVEIKGNGRRINQLIDLQRHQSENSDEGQRTLSWDLMVDKDALAEMMELLGPPGGFGELGFNVTKDRVCFGAMGIGTRFNLTFIVETEGIDKQK